MSLPKIALVYSDRERPDTTAGHVFRALPNLVEVLPVHPAALSSLSTQDADLFIRIDDDLHYRWPDHLRPAAYWAIDTHQDYRARLQNAYAFDKVFCAQKAGVARMQADGIAATWLPLACSPDYHGKRDVAREYDICMVGFIPPGSPRADLVAFLRAHFPRVFAGNFPYQELGLAYSRAPLAFNRSIGGDLNMRVFEALCAGVLLLTDKVQGLDDLFEPGTHLVTYDSTVDIGEKARYYLANAQARETIAAAGRERVLDRHTYRHRAAVILQAFGLWKDERPYRPRRPRANTVRQATCRNQASTSSTPTGEAKDRPNVAGPLLIRTGAKEPYSRRLDVLEHVPVSARSILEIGCSTGGLGEAIKERARRADQPMPWIAGVEVVADLAASAQTRLDAVFAADIEALLREAPAQLLAPLQQARMPGEKKKAQPGQSDAPGQRQDALYDCIIFADSLEHLRDPETVLRSLRPLLSGDGTLVLSVPNVRHREILQGLAQGRWTYRDAGLLDRTHLRFFTRCDLEQALFRAGYDVLHIRPTFTPDHDQWKAMGRPGALDFGGIRLEYADPAEMEAFFTYQWMVIAQPRPPANFGLTSIIILTCNQLPYTQMCVDSIRRHTWEPYELIFVDNGSTDGTLEYLKSLSNVTILRNEANLGFPKGCNQGIAAAQGSAILLLNNDTIVAEGWLTRLLTALYSREDVAAVGPRSNFTSGPANLYEQPPALSQIDTYAWELGRQWQGLRFAMDGLSGFCLLLRRTALDRIGLLDETFGAGLYEDTDLCRRLRQAGFRLLCACDAYVYHFGGRTFGGEGVDFSAQWKIAEEAYTAKWGKDPSSQSLPEQERRSVPSVLLPPLPERPRISACVVSDHAGPSLEALLHSIQGAVDEVVVITTDSTNKTHIGTATCKVRVEQYASTADCVALRNAALAHAVGDWILWLEPDETLPAASLPRLQELIRTAAENVAGYVFTIRSSPLDAPHDVTLLRQVRLSRDHAALRFVDPMLEHLSLSLRQAGFQTAFASVEVLSSGRAAVPAIDDRQAELYSDTWAQACEKHPEDPFAHYALGTCLCLLQRWEEAKQQLQQSIAHFALTDPWLARAFARLVTACQQAHGTKAALRAALMAIQVCPQDPELQFLAGELFRKENRLTEARGCYERLLMIGSEQAWSGCLSAGIFSYITLHALALTQRELGEIESCEQLLAYCLNNAPFYLPAWITFAEMMLAKGNMQQVGEAVAQILRLCPADPQGLAFRGRLLLMQGNFVAARQDLATAVTLRPGDTALRHLLVQSLLGQRFLDEAEQELRGILTWEPHDATALYNLGMVLAETGRIGEAISSLERALQNQPDHRQIRFRLALMLRAAGQAQAAADHLKYLLKMNPDDPTVMYELGETLLCLWQPEQARPYFERILRLDASHPAVNPSQAMLAGGLEVHVRNRHGIERLATLHPYPAEKPAVPENDHGWLREGTALALRAHLSYKTLVVVELGSWLGRSTRLIADCAPNARVIAIDHWRGSVEHHENAEWRALLPTLYETFLTNCWQYRERIIPVCMSTQEGLELVASLGIQADLVYIDASHDYDSVCRDLTAVLRHFQTAAIVGDDWPYDGVYRAVTDTIHQLGITRPIGYNADAWWLDYDF